jgi:hypothetical protein
MTEWIDGVFSPTVISLTLTLPDGVESRASEGADEI